MLPRSKELISLKRIAAGLLVLWVAVVIGMTFLSARIYQSSNEYMLYVLRRMAANASNHASEVVEANLEELRLYAERLTDEQLADIRNSSELFTTIRDKNGYRNMCLALADGTCYVRSDRPVNVSAREYFQRAMKGESNLSYLVKSYLDDSMVNIYAVPVERDGKVVAVLWASVVTQEFFHNIGLDNYEDYGSIYLVNDEGTLISEREMGTEVGNFFAFIRGLDHPENSKNLRRLDQMEEDFRTKTDGYQRFRYQGQDVFMYYTNMPIDDWWLMVKIPRQTLWSLSMVQVNLIWAVSGVLLVLATVDFGLIALGIRRVSRKLRRQSHVDVLTGRNNDLYLKDNIASLLAEPGRFALVSLEASNLHALVSVLGLQSVQEMVCHLYDKLEATLQPGEAVAHSYFGEYKLLLRYTTVESLLQRVEALNQLDSKLELLMGIYPIEDTNQCYEDMCSCTNVAKCNCLPDCNYGIYTRQLHDQEIGKAALEEQIRGGIDRQEFRAWFQPKYAADGRTLAGAEALVRWYLDGQVVGPYRFIPLCEANGMIRELDCLVLEDVCRNLQQWLRDGLQPVPVSVNLSRNYLDEPDFIQRLERIIAVYQVPRQLIAFEVTESAMAGNEKRLQETIDLLHQKGFEIMLDDFGVGYSSIKTISDLHFDTVKIDKSFVDGIGQEQWENIIRYTIALSKQMNMKVVAEGVETREQYEFLAANGCDAIQGYYFAKPMDESDFGALLAGR